MRRAILSVFAVAFTITVVVGCSGGAKMAAEPMAAAETAMAVEPTPPKETAMASQSTEASHSGFNIGDRAPAFALPDTMGESVSLADYAGKPVVVVFYRGYWCPVCQRQLEELQASYEAFQAAGAAVLAISVDPPEQGRTMQVKSGATFPLLGDPSRDTVKAYGVIDPDSNPFDADVTHPNIARAAVFVIDGDGVIRWKYWAETVRDRPTAGNILEVVQSLSDPKIKVTTKPKTGPGAS
ncbi:MAG: peroxiredoxin family protein [Candidatus Poribacteria bacterium]|nr:peroxiredoxin family protein [Candidatus Poribacteria bacterium]